MHILSGLAFRSPLHARALPNLEGRALEALRSVGLDSGTLWCVDRLIMVIGVRC
jgi:hypothetical protein